MSKQNTRTVQIFRAGKHVAVDGKEYEFSEADVAAIAAAYDPSLHLAPVVIGHPKTDAPAYAWAEALRIEDGVLVADLDKINPAFAEAVSCGSYRKISPSLYGPDQKGNPTPGQYHLRHIGFLGAAPPGVKGLAPVEFAETDEYIAFADGEEMRPVVWLARTLGRALNGLRDWLIEEKGLEKANEILPAWDTDQPAEIAAEISANINTNRPAFAEGDNRSGAGKAAAAQGDKSTGAVIEGADQPDPLADREQRLSAREAAFAEKEAARAAGEAEARRTEDSEFLDGLVTAGRLAPGFKPMIAAFCEALDGGDAIAFAEGEAAQDPRVGFKAFLNEHLGQSILFSEVAAGDGLRFAEGRSADDHTAAIEAEMAAAEAAGRPISAAQAATRLKRR